MSEPIEPDCTDPECGICHQCHGLHLTSACPDLAGDRAVAAERERIFREVVGPLVEAIGGAGVWVKAWLPGIGEVRSKTITAEQHNAMWAALANARAQMEADK